MTGDSLGEVVLRDVRMSFDSFTLHRKGVIQEASRIPFFSTTFYMFFVYSMSQDCPNGLMSISVAPKLEVYVSTKQVGNSGSKPSLYPKFSCYIGSKLAVTLLVGCLFFISLSISHLTSQQHYLPTVFAVMDPYPVAVLSGRNLPDGTPVSDGERTYTNSCTIKVKLNTP